MTYANVPTSCWITLDSQLFAKTFYGASSVKHVLQQPTAFSVATPLISRHDV